MLRSSMRRIQEHYPMMWQGALSLRSADVAVQLFFIAGNRLVANRCLLQITDVEPDLIRIRQRMKLLPPNLADIYMKLQLPYDYSLLLALPFGENESSLEIEANILRHEFIGYLIRKNAAGIVQVADSITQQPAYVIKVLHSCDVIQTHFVTFYPTLHESIDEIPHLLFLMEPV